MVLLSIRLLRGVLAPDLRNRSTFVAR